jgi:hypothetical protein
LGRTKETLMHPLRMATVLNTDGRKVLTGHSGKIRRIKHIMKSHNTTQRNSK